MERERRQTQSDRKGFSGRTKKRRWCGKKRSSNNPHQEQASTSSKKIRGNKTEEDPAEKPHNGYRQMHQETIFDFLASELVCKTCGGEVNFKETAIRGLE